MSSFIVGRDLNKWDRVGGYVTVMLELRNISKSFQEDLSEKHLFQHVCVNITDGHRICCTGESGQGKTSLLKIIARLDVPNNGQLYWHNVEASRCDVMLWRQQIHYVAQQAVMLPGTVKDNLQLPSLLHGRVFQQDKAQQLMNQCGLQQLDWQTSAESLSGGEKQRIALIRGLLLEPKILLLDEVTGSLDTHNRDLVESLLLQWIEETNGSFVWISHDPNQVKRVSSEQWYFAEHHVTICREETSA
ncbi:ABC transporter ATP-binding protein [Paenibacillus endoradicis]|uniref:ABC transporter ATP-binding protein n=1 Tax=Paenibacillus endoradicis TaxID=2972487 RepID=UPI0021594441|nr:ATP-binding cassette domain-containing protein [Paenibacillus endoradicis]MCR8657834.1 ATP-binding cassette domain-containing protein [Paenibacillus endoradicis]